MRLLRKLFSLVFGARSTHRGHAGQICQPQTRRPQPSKNAAREELEVLQTLGSLPLAKVKKVVDGDTVVLSMDGATRCVRLDAIDCPEGNQPWGYTAHAALIRLIAGRTVRAEIHGTDTHGRTLATLYVLPAGSAEWTNVNERMLILGHAWVMPMFIDHLPKSRQAKLWRLQNWSRSRRLGLWGTEAPVPPWAWRRSERERLRVP